MKKYAAAVAAIGLVLASGGIAMAQPDTTVVNPPPVVVTATATPPPLTVTLPPPPPPVTVTVTAPPPTTTTTPPPTTTTPPPQACGGPINITTGGTYTGCYRSDVAGTPAVRISTTQPVTLSRARIIAKGNGVYGYDQRVQLTVRDSVFEQTNPGAVVEHRAVTLYQPVSFVFENNTLTDSDGVRILGATSLQVNPLTVRYNTVTNIGRYPHPLGSNCCVQFLQLDKVISPAGLVQWNKVRNVSGQSGVEDNISLYQSGGTDTTHKFDIGNNLIDGAYPRTTGCLDSCGAEYRGGGILVGDSGGGHGLIHDNTVISTTNYGIAPHGNDNYAVNNLLVNDGVEQTSNFGQAISVDSPTPPGLHATGTKYNWRRTTASTNQFPCWRPEYCSGTQVSTTEQQARDSWEAARATAGVVVGPRP